MNILQELINSLNTDDVKAVKVFLSRANKDPQRKDILLFDTIRRSGEKYQDEKFHTKLYPDGNRNAYFSLKSKLLADISKFLVFAKIDEDIYLKIIEFFFLGKFFESKNKISLSQHYFKKAEKLAIKNELDELLLMIYHFQIQKSNIHPFQNPEPLIIKRQKLRRKMEDLLEIEDLLTIIKFNVQNSASGNEELSKELEKKIKKFTQKDLNLQSTKTRIKIYSAISSLLLQRHSFKYLESYTRKVLAEFEKEKLFTKENHSEKLNMIIYLINSLYNQKKYKESLEATEWLHTEMLAYKKLYYNKYLLHYLNSLLLNFSAQNKNKALKFLLEWKNNSSLKESEYYPVFINLNLALLYFSEKNYPKAIRSINSLYHHTLYHSFLEEFKIQINFTEMIIRFDSGELDFLEIKIRRFEKDFEALLKNPAFVREKEFLEILKEMSESHDWKRNKNLIKRIKKLISSPKKKEINKEFINYTGWLACKVGENPPN